MFITDGVSNYDRISEDLLALVRTTGASARAPRLGGSTTADVASVPLFNEECTVQAAGVHKGGARLDVIGSILVARYLLQAGDAPITGMWVPYRDLKDGSQFSSYIKTHIEDRMAAAFSGRPDELAARLARLGGVPCHEEMADIVRLVRPLPKVPVLCLFDGKDSEFPASFRFLFDASASSYLDLESLAAVLHYIYLKVTGEI
jgi:hypothetical protein